jgi:formylmethanofuran dehydrogenase subunit B
LCDDLVVEARGDELAVRKNGCARAMAAFERPRPTGRALIDGERASHTAAIGAAVKILKRAQSPLISGLGTDVDGAREAVALAERSRAMLDHANSAGLDSGMRILQSRGWYTTTLAEVRNRADLIILVGADVVTHYANFMRRIVEPQQTLDGERREHRRVFHIGTQQTAPATTKFCAVETIRTAASDLAETMSQLRATVGGRASARGTRARRLAALADAIKQAAYPVFVWAPGQLPRGDADLTIAATTRLIDDLNQHQRAAGLVLGGDNGAISAVSACTWLTGFPLHISFAGKTIDYDPVRYRTERLLRDRAVDALVWIDAFGDSPVPELGDGIKRIAIGHPQAAANTRADVFIPVGTPGIDHRGRLVRTDSVVTLHVDQVRPRGFRSAAGVLQGLLEQW